MKRTNTTPYSIILSTVFIAAFCDIKAINSYLAVGMGESGEMESGPMALVYVLSALGAFMTGVLSSQRKGRKIPEEAVFILLWVTGSYFFTQLLIAQPYTKFLYFAVLTLVSFALPFFTQIDGRLFLRMSMLLAFPAIFNVNEIFVFREYSDSITMGQSYAFLFPVVAAIVYSFTYFKNDNILWKIISILLFFINGVYAFYLIFFGSRGPVFAILALVVFLLIFKHSDRGTGIKTMKGGFALVGGMILIVAFSLVFLMSSFQDVLGRYGVSLYFVDKFMNMNDRGDMTNGRQVIYLLSFADIVQHPFFGLGFDQFSNNHGNATGINYPHNFLIQVLYDGGIVLLLVLGVPIIRALKKTWKRCTLDEYAIIVALFFGSVPRALFSGDLWQNGPLWMLFGILLCDNFTRKPHGVNNALLIQKSNERIS